MFGKPVHLAQVSYSSLGTALLDVQKVEPRSEDGEWQYVAGILVLIRLALSSASTSDAITQDQFLRILSQFQIFDPNGVPWLDNDFNGCALRELERVMMQRGYHDPIAIAANSNTTHAPIVTAYLPYSLPKVLKEQDACLPLAAELSKLRYAFAASTIYGTGQTIGTTTMDLIADVVTRPRLRLKGRLKYGYRTPTTWDKDRHSVFGRLVYLGLHDIDGAATPTIGTTDFTHYELRGRQFNVSRQENDIPTILARVARLNVGDAHDAAIAIPNVAACKANLLYMAPARSDISKLPEEAELQLSLTRGAGAPALTDQVVMMARVVAREEEKQAKALGAVQSSGVHAADVVKALAPAAEGKAGTIPVKSRMGRYLSRPVQVR